MKKKKAYSIPKQLEEKDIRIGKLYRVTATSGPGRTALSTIRTAGRFAMPVLFDSSYRLWKCLVGEEYIWLAPCELTWHTTKPEDCKWISPESTR